MTDSVKEITEIALLLRDRTPRQRLAPSRPWDLNISGRIGNIEWGSSPEALALKAGLLLWNDDLDASHSISQEVETETGSFWHGIMHRMEGDYGNAKYWFRLTGVHPVFRKIAARAATTVSEYIEASQGSAITASERALLSGIVRDGAWNAYAFADAVEQAVRGQQSGTEPRANEVLEKLQQDEIEALVSYCFYQVFGGTLFVPNKR